MGGKEGGSKCTTEKRAFLPGFDSGSQIATHSSIYLARDWCGDTGSEGRRAQRQQTPVATATDA